MEFQKWLANNFVGLRLIPLSFEDYKPGCIVGRETPSIYEYAWNVLGETGNEDHWKVKEGPAQLINTTFSRETAVKSSVALLGLLSFNADLSKSVQSTIDVKGIRVKGFSNLPPMQLDQRLRTLQTAGSPKWKKIDEKRVITYCYAVLEMHVTFQEAGKVLGEADVKKLVKPSITAGAKVEWSASQVLEIKSAGSIPFGFQSLIL